MPRRPLPVRWWFATLVLAVALPLSSILAWTFFTELRRDQSAAREAALRAARAVAGEMRRLHRDSLDLLDRFAGRSSMRDFKPGDCDPLFSIVEFFPQYADLIFFDARGNVVCAAPAATEEDRRLTISARQWLAGELRRGAMKMRVPMVRSINGEWVSAVATPVELGVLALVQLPEITGREVLPSSAVVTIVDRDGRIVARTRESERWTGQSASAAAIVQIARTKREGTAEATGVDGVHRQYGFTYVPELGWYIYVGIPTAGPMQRVRDTLVRGVVAGVLIVAGVMLIAALLSRAITRPLGAMARSVSRVASGGYEPVPVEGPAEIASVAHAVNEMVANRVAHERQIADNAQQLKALSDQLLASQEEERAWLAREIHDDLGQSLTALKMDVLGLLRNTPQETSPLRDRIVRTLDETVTSVQRLTAELRPPLLDDLGLVAAIESEARLFEERSGIEVELSLPANAPPLEKATATTVYRIVQEALTNVMRHADATRVEVRMRQRARELLVDIRDDGRGATSSQLESADSFGLLGMRERAAIAGGTVTIAGVEGRGTIVSVQIPLERQNPGA